MKTKPLFYIASPFTHKLYKIRQKRVEMVTEATIKLVQNGIHAFSPIAYNGNWERRDLPTDWGFWGAFDKNFLKRCDGLVVLTMDGWDKSVGINEEIKYAKRLKIPVCYISYEEIMTGWFDQIRAIEK